MPLLAAVPVGDAARQARIVVRADEPVRAALTRMDHAAVPGAPVVDRDGLVIGLVDADRLRGHDDGRVGDTPFLREPILAADDGLDDGLGALADHRRSWAPVVAQGGHLAGVLSVRDAIAAYRSALSGNVQQMRGLRADGVILEADVQPGSAIAGKTVSEVTWPLNTVLVAVERAGGPARAARRPRPTAHGPPLDLRDRQFDDGAATALGRRRSDR